MRMPNSDRALVDLTKLRDYCLSLDHPRGRHKARVFRAVLGLTSEDAESLGDDLQHAAANAEATVGERDSYGQRFTLDVLISGPSGQARVRSLWIVRIDEDFPRLTSCFVL